VASTKTSFFLLAEAGKEFNGTALCYSILKFLLSSILKETRSSSLRSMMSTPKKKSEGQNARFAPRKNRCSPREAAKQRKEPTKQSIARIDCSQPISKSMRVLKGVCNTKSTNTRQTSAPLRHRRRLCAPTVGRGVEASFAHRVGCRSGIELAAGRAAARQNHRGSAPLRAASTRHTQSLRSASSRHMRTMTVESNFPSIVGGRAAVARKVAPGSVLFVSLCSRIENNLTSRLTWLLFQHITLLVILCCETVSILSIYP
jgi:hypothetical protein